MFLRHSVVSDLCGVSETCATSLPHMLLTHQLTLQPQRKPDIWLSLLSIEGSNNRTQFPGWYPLVVHSYCSGTLGSLLLFRDPLGWMLPHDPFIPIARKHAVLHFEMLGPVSDKPPKGYLIYPGIVSHIGVQKGKTPLMTGTSQIANN